MTYRIWSKNFGVTAIVTGLMAASVYLLMINITLPHIKAVSGHIPFDMRPMGYGTAEAAALLGGLGVDGREYYLTRQIPLDTMYPALLGLTLVATMCWFGKHMSNSKLLRVGIAFSVGAALFDYAENLGIVAMILSWPDTSAPLINATSITSIAKSVLTTLAVLLLLLIGFNWARQAMAEKST